MVYTLLAEIAGFVITASLILFGLLLKLGTRPIPSLLITLAVVPCIYLFFAYVLRVPLPRGWFG